MLAKFNICNVGIISISSIWQEEMRWHKQILRDEFDASNLELYSNYPTTQKSRLSICFIFFFFLIVLTLLYFLHLLASLWLYNYRLNIHMLPWYPKERRCIFLVTSWSVRERLFLEAFGNLPSCTIDLDWVTSPF